MFSLLIKLESNNIICFALNLHAKFSLYVCVCDSFDSEKSMM